MNNLDRSWGGWAFTKFRFCYPGILIDHPPPPPFKILKKKIHNPFSWPLTIMLNYSTSYPNVCMNFKIRNFLHEKFLFQRCMIRSHMTVSTYEPHMVKWHLGAQLLIIRFTSEFNAQDISFPIMYDSRMLIFHPPPLLIKKIARDFHGCMKLILGLGYL